MLHTRYNWPLTEATPERAAFIDGLPPKMREAKINKLKAEIMSGELERQRRWRTMEAHADQA